MVRRKRLIGSGKSQHRSETLHYPHSCTRFSSQNVQEESVYCPDKNCSFGLGDSPCDRYNIDYSAAKRMKSQSVLGKEKQNMHVMRILCFYLLRTSRI